MIVDVWKDSDGLPQNTVRSILQSSNGFLFAGTYEGLVRFDGINFTVYDRRTFKEFNNNSVISLLEGKDSSLYIGTNGSSVIRLRKGQLYTLKNSLEGQTKSVRSLKEMSDGSVWAGSSGGGAFQIKNDSTIQLLNRTHGLASDFVNAFETDFYGRLWICTNNGLNYLENGNVYTFPFVEKGLTFISIVHLNESLIWVGTNKGIFEIDVNKLIVTQQFTIQHGLASNLITYLFNSSSGTVWVGTDGGGIAYYSGNKFHHLTTKNSNMSSNTVWTITEDHEKSIWVGTSNGINRIRIGKFVNFSTIDGLSNNFSRSIISDKNGTIYVGTDGNGLHEFSDNRFIQLFPKNETGDIKVTSLFVDQSEHLWVGTSSGLYKKPFGKLVQRILLPPTYHTTAIASISQASNGNIYVGTYGNGIYILKDDQFVTDLKKENGLSIEFIRMVFTDKKGTTWIGTNGGGLNQINDNKIIQHPLKGIPKNATIFTIHEDEMHDLWIGSDQGIFLYSDSTTHIFTQKEGLFNDVAFRILEDNQERLWISCNQGIYSIPKIQFKEIMYGRRLLLEYTSYGLSEGMRSKQVNGGSTPAGWMMKNGEMWFPTAEGISIFDPENENRNTIPPPVVIESINGIFSDHYLRHQLTFPSNQRKLEIIYSGLSYISPIKVKFKYILEGFDSTWIDAGNRRFATYTNIPHGTYTLRVIAANNDNYWNMTGDSLIVTFEPNFHETWWFILLSLVVIISTLTISHKMRVAHHKKAKEQLKQLVFERTKELEEEKERTELALVETEAAKKEAERQRDISENAMVVIAEQSQKIIEMDQIKSKFFSNISHEFRTPLTLTIGPLENALGGIYGDVDQQLAEQLNLMLRNSRRLLRLINQLLDISKMESGKMELKAHKGNFSRFLSDLTGAFASYALRRQIELKFESQHQHIELYFDTDKMDKIFYNLLSNAFKFTPIHGTISITISETESTVEVVISDTGKGIPEEDLPHIFERFRQAGNADLHEMSGSGIGLSLVKDFTELHKGELSVASAMGKGTSFILTFLKGNSHLLPEQVVEIPNIESEYDDIQGLNLELSELDAQDHWGSDKINSSSPLHTKQDHPYTILVVDDNKDIRKYIHDILKDSYKLVEGNNGKVGLKVLEEQSIDLVISDVMMPVMNGYDFCKAMRDNPIYSHIPIILLTAKATAQMKAEGLELGANDYMYKPFYAKELLARVKNLIRLSEQEKELKRINLDLESSNYALKQANELKTELLNIAAHDLRNPLQSIMGFSELLEPKLEADPSLQKYVHNIYTASQRMLHQIKEILDNAAIEAGMIQLKLKLVNITEITQQVIYHLQLSAQSKNQHIDFSTTDPFYIFADENRLSEIIENLISNAIKYSPKNKRIGVSIYKKSQTIALAVQDEGPGFTLSDKQKIFGKFQRLSARPTGGETSTGLGLSIVKQLVELHHGKIWVESEEGNGSTFVIEFPMNP